MHVSHSQCVMVDRSEVAGPPSTSVCEEVCRHQPVALFLEGVVVWGPCESTGVAICDCDAPFLRILSCFLCIPEISHINQLISR